MNLSITSNYIDNRLQDRRESNLAVKNERRAKLDRRNPNILTKLQNDVDRLDSRVVKVALTALSPVPTLRRVNSVPDSIEEKNYTRAAGTAALALANSPRDIEELARALKTGFSKNPYQYECSFFKGTFLEVLPDKFKCLQKLDKTLFNTKSGKFLQKTCGIGIDVSDISNIKNSSSKTIAKGFKYIGNFAQKTAGSALHRIPVIGLYLAALFEVPALVKSVTKTEGTIIDKAKAFSKQLIKSAGYVGFTTAGIAIGGALLFPHGAVLGLLGMAVGSAVSLAMSKKLNREINEI